MDRPTLAVTPGSDLEREILASSRPRRRAILAMVQTKNPRRRKALLRQIERLSRR